MVPRDLREYLNWYCTIIVGALFTVLGTSIHTFEIERVEGRVILHEAGDCPTNTSQQIIIIFSML